LKLNAIKTENSNQEKNTNKNAAQFNKNAGQLFERQLTNKTKLQKLNCMTAKKGTQAMGRVKDLKNKNIPRN